MCTSQDFGGVEQHGHWYLGTQAEGSHDSPSFYFDRCGRRLDTLDTEAFDGKWVMFLGDSNTRGVFFTLRELLGASEEASVPTAVNGSEDTDAFYYFYTKRALFTFGRMFWCYDDTEAATQLTSNVCTLQATVDVPLTLTSVLEAGPDKYVVSVGSHCIRAPRSAVQAMSLRLQGLVEYRRDTSGRCADDRLVFVTTVAMLKYLS